jgi:hypothetical protein
MCWKHNFIGTKPWPAGQGVGLASPTLGQLVMSFLPCHLPRSYYLRLHLVLDIMKICMDFSPYDAFPSSDVLEVDQQNSWNSLVIDTYLLYLAWNVGMLAVNICILWPPTLTTTRKVAIRWPREIRIVCDHTRTERGMYVSCWSAFPYMVYINSYRRDSRIWVTACLRTSSRS